MLFGGAVICIIIALAAFLTETFLAWRELARADSRQTRGTLAARLAGAVWTEIGGWWSRAWR
jgi:hypothetical protein